MRLGLSVADDLCRADLLMPVSGVATAIDCYHEHAYKPSKSPANGIQLYYYTVVRHDRSQAIRVRTEPGHHAI
eukprot:SAG25_NODE_4660_length_773_cov_1.044510_2_plen_73_part_00